MRFIKLFLISAVVLFLVVTALAAFFPSNLRMSRAIDITASKENVFKNINDLKEWDKWNQFVINAPLTNKKNSIPSFGDGAFITSDQLKIIIDKSTADSVTTFWDQSNGKHFSGGYNLFELRPGTITVQFYFDFHFRWYPWEKFSSLLYEREIGTVMEGSLNKLKEISENSK
jgi:hypothetical protein